MKSLLKEILQAKIYDLVKRTPLDFAPILSKSFENSIYIKREDLQPVFSFKLRGAYNKIRSLQDVGKGSEIVCASAGNHAQGVALSSKHLGLKAKIFMPETTPLIKIEAVKNLGAEVVLKGQSYSDTAEECAKYVAENDCNFVHPFDDPLVIAGQGTIGKEIFEELPDADYVFVAIGGGGLISGVANYLKEVNPEVRIIGVEPEDSNAMSLSIEKGEIVNLPHVGIFADGVAVKRVGDLAFEMTKQYVDDFIRVNTDEICSGIKRVYEDTRSIAEPAGALATAGVVKYVRKHQLKGKKIVAINCGANMNFTRLQFVAERTLLGEKKEALFTVTIPEEPGSLKKLCDEVIKNKDITEFNYRLMGRNKAHIFIGIAIQSFQEREHFFEVCNQKGFVCEDLSDNEIAKTHIRHMVGGRSKDTKSEVLYHFQFPEQKNSLLEFLVKMSSDWNISLFHYRFTGGDFGRVLVGLEIPDSDHNKFQQFLSDTNYNYSNESENIAYKRFL